MIITTNARADRQIEAAASWWREHRSSEAIAEQLEWIVGHLRINPRLGERIGYHLYYRVDETAGRIVIVAFWHERRRPLRL
jgi:hypothetical protein